jgi:hypothetical protein
MKKAFPLLAILALALLVFSQAAQQVNVTGDWELTFTTQRGPTTMNINFKQEGEKLTVTTTGRGGEEIKAEGTVKGNEIAWTITRSTERGEFKQAFKGKIEGDTISGQFTMTTPMGERGPTDWKATRKK